MYPVPLIINLTIFYIHNFVVICIDSLSESLKYKVYEVPLAHSYPKSCYIQTLIFFCI